MLKKLTIFIFLLTGFAWSFSVSAATCPMDNGAGVGCNAGNNEYYCGSACRQLSAGTTPTLNFCQNNFQVCAPGVDCSNSYAAAFPCGVPQACNGGFTLCNVAGTGASSFPDSKCKANSSIPAGCSTYNQCTNVCSACSAGYELLAGSCIGATVRLGTDSVMSDRLKNSTMPLMSILSSGNVGIGTTIPNDIFSIGNSGSAPLGSVNTGHNYTSTYLSADDYALVNYGLVKTLIDSATSSSALWGGIIGGNVWNLNSGNVGIGTTSPAAKLDVIGNISTNGALGTSVYGTGQIIASNPNSGGGSGFYAQLNNTGSSYGGYGLGYGTSVKWIFGMSRGIGDTTGLVFYEDGMAAKPRMMIATGGNVGIGTTNPTSVLEVGGNHTDIAGIINRASIVSNSDSIQSFQLENLSSGAAAEMRFVTRANNGHYMAFTSPSSGNTGSWMGLTKSMGNFLFSYGRTLALSTFTANDIVLGTNNTENVRIKSGGNVGIGTSAPNDTLSIGNSGTAPVGSLATGHNFTSTYLTTDDYALTNYGIVKSLISSSATTNALWNGTKNGNIWNGDAGVGNVGIGTTNPTSKLFINSGGGANSGIVIRSDGSTGSYASLDYRNKNNVTLQTGLYDSGDAFFYMPSAGNNIGFYTSDLQRMTIAKSGNIGIGTITPNATLEISASTTAFSELRVTNPSSSVTTGAGGAVLNFYTKSTDTLNQPLGSIQAIKQGVYQSGLASSYTSDLAFLTEINAVNTEKMRITSAGNVGIGTTNPTALLDVTSTTFPKAMINFSKKGSGDWGITLGNESVPNVYIGLSGSMTDYFWRANWNTSGVAGNTFQSASNTDNALTAVEILQKRAGNTGDYLHITSNGGASGNIMTVLNNGNVGIGTTIPNDIFSIGNSGSAPIGSDHTGHNYTMTYLSSDPYALVNYGTTMSLINAATSSSALWSGTKNGSIYNGDAGAGSVGIGTTTPSAPLEVIGTSNTTGSVRITAPNVGDAPWMEFSTPGVGIMGRITNSNGFRFKSNYDVSMVAGAGAGNGFKVWNPAATIQYLTILGSNGNVGIGTTSPRVKLDISGSSPKLRLANDVQNAGEVGIEFSHSAYLGLSEVKNAIVTKPNGGYGRADMYFVLDSASDSNGYTSDAVDTKMLIQGTTGNVGIGTTNPGARLDLGLGTGNPGNLRLSSYGFFGLNYSSGDLSMAYNAKANESSVSTMLVANTNGSVGYSFIKVGNGGIMFHTKDGAVTAGNLAYSERMRITGNGNVGIGTTIPNDTFSIGNAGSAPLGSVNTGHNYTSTYLSADDYALTNYGLVKTLIASATSSSALFGGTVAGDIWNLNTGNFGIGTTTPAAKLDLVGLMKMRVATSSITQAEDVVNKAYLDFKIGTANTVGKYVGVTVATYSGNNSALGVGYDKANDQCAADVPGSHVCATSEILNTIATKGAMPTDGIVWVFNGPPGYTVEANDCDGRASNRSTSYGAVWQTDISKWTNGRGMLTTCNNSNKFACCK